MITKQQYLSECNKGLVMIYAASLGGNPANPKDSDTIMVAMGKPGDEKPLVSYVRIDSQYHFMRGHPAISCPIQ